MAFGGLGVLSYGWGKGDCVDCRDGEWSVRFVDGGRGMVCLSELRKGCWVWGGGCRVEVRAKGGGWGRRLGGRGGLGVRMGDGDEIGDWGKGEG